MPEAAEIRAWDRHRFTLAGNVGSGEIIQCRDGRAGYFFHANNVGLSTGDIADPVRTSGIVQVPKTNGIVFLDGGPVYWDHSANAAHYKQVSDRDFFMGSAVGDWSSGDTGMQVNLNVSPRYLIDLARDAWVDAVTGTQAAGGFGPFRRKGGSHTGLLTATSEIQKIDMLSVEGMAPGAKWIVEGAFRVINDGAGANTDVSLGPASATHATDADAIAEHLFLHLDGNSTNISLQSKDGTTTVAAVDTTSDYTESPLLANRVEFWFDGRNTADIQCYLNGVLTLGGSTFRLDNAASTLFLLAHVEKASSADVYELALDFLRVRIAQQ